MNFSSNQCVQINNSEEFEVAYPYLRSANLGVSFNDYTKNGMPTFPLYLEKVNSVTR